MFEKLINQINDAVYIVDTNTGGLLDFNDVACKMLGYTRKELLNMKVPDICLSITDQNIWDMKLKETKEKGHLILEGDQRRKDGSSLTVELNIKYISHEKNDYLTVIARDITERKKAEELVKASLKEKEVLLQEIHHRVKNNMTVISSLLKLQSDKIKDEQYIDIFNSSIDRIKTMALIHEKLYESQDLAKVNFNNYLKDMINNMLMSCGLNSQKVAFKTDVQDITLGVDTAIPCGLIINELVSNSIKYAFPEGKEGEIKVSLRRNGTAEVKMTISDNGVGMPEDVDFRNTDSLGLNLVNTLVKQIQGKMELNKEKGSKFEITFRRR
ncbi:MAG: PAS domain-containing sensor histidine kinase [Candidatus Hodarchaeales archaeon]|jgi:PAS domain S-box-containing protein